jgi:hypothetical protein
MEIPGPTMPLALQVLDAASVARPFPRLEAVDQRPHLGDHELLCDRHQATQLREQPGCVGPEGGDFRHFPSALRCS